MCIRSTILLYNSKIEITNGKGYSDEKQTRNNLEVLRIKSTVQRTLKKI